MKIVILCLLVGSGVVWAQANTAQINGDVRDASGLAVPDATIQVTQTSTGTTRTTTSGADGSFILPDLSIGPYKLEISKAGFAKYVQSGIVLQVDSKVTKATRMADRALMPGVPTARHRRRPTDAGWPPA